MQRKEDLSEYVDRFTQVVMRQVSRRGLLKGLGALGLTLIGFSTNIRDAMAAIVCPPSCGGECDICFSWCSTGGMVCSIECPSCHCSPPVVAAVGVWIPVPGSNKCIFNCQQSPC